MNYNTNIKATANYMSILGSVLGQLSDGIWENTPSMNKYWKSLEVKSDAENNIVIVDKYNVCNDAIDFMANKIKQIIKIEIDDGNNKLYWDRCCTEKPVYIGYRGNITVGECYQLYDLLKGRDISRKVYTVYKPFEVKMNINGVSEPITITVEAITKYQAMEIAKDQLLNRIKFEIKDN